MNFEEYIKPFKSNAIVALENLFNERESESLYLEFKTSSNNGQGKNLTSIDKDNLAKCVSGFSNSEGGVVIWGVNCKKDDYDLPSSLRLLEKPERFSSAVKELVSRISTPINHKIEVESFLIEEKKGIVLMNIPKFEGSPIQSIVHWNYYMRSGSSFTPIPHGILEGFFGKRPLCDIIHYNELKVVEGFDVPFDIILRNNGIPLAKTLFFNITKTKCADNSVKFTQANIQEVQYRSEYGIKLGCVTNKNVILAHDFSVKIVGVLLNFQYLKNRDLELNFNYGCENSIIKRFKINVPKEVSESYYSRILGGVKPSTVLEELLNHHTKGDF